MPMAFLIYNNLWAIGNLFHININKLGQEL